jgi:AraC family transcriptional regulator, regulatory protein of adaptative response / DNA-3-methyladenine glycosylase II
MIDPFSNTHTIYDRARLARDARFDGLFFIAVRSTKIYCRPICPAPTPKAENVTYFATAFAAHAAGFRPCLRCRPELAPGGAWQRLGASLVDRALSMISDGALEHSGVEPLARRLGISSRQLQRLFLAHVGTTPKIVHTHQRMLLAKQLLTETALAITDVALASGFRSIRQFNAAFLLHCAKAPSMLRKNQRALGVGNLEQTKIDAQVLRLRLGYRPPLDFAAMLQFLHKRAIPGIETITPDGYERFVGGVSGACRIRVSAAKLRAELVLEIWNASAPEIPAIVRRTRRLFDLDADLVAVHAVLRESPVLAQSIDRRPGLRVPGCWDGFELAVRAVLGQQISVAGATTLARRLVQQFGPQNGPAFVQPAQLCEANLEQIGLPKARANTLRALARAVCAHQIDFASGQSLEDFVRKFTIIPGIGAWTAHYVAMRALAHPDAFPAGDLVLQNRLGTQNTSGPPKRLSEKATEAYSQAWRPWRAYAVLHLWFSASDDVTQANPPLASLAKAGKLPSKMQQKPEPIPHVV